MSEIAPIITAVALLITSLGTIGSLVLGWKIFRQGKATHVATNSLVTKLLTEGKEASFAEGRARGRQERDTSDLPKATGAIGV